MLDQVQWVSLDWVWLGLVRFSGLGLVGWVWWVGFSGLDQVQWVRLDQVRLDQVRLGLVGQVQSVGLGQVRLGQVQCVGLGWVRFSRLGLVCIGLVSSGLASLIRFSRLGQARMTPQISFQLKFMSQSQPITSPGLIQSHLNLFEFI